MEKGYFIKFLVCINYFDQVLETSNNINFKKNDPDPTTAVNNKKYYYY